MSIKIIHTNIHTIHTQNGNTNLIIYGFSRALKKSKVPRNKQSERVTHHSNNQRTVRFSEI